MKRPLTILAVIANVVYGLIFAYLWFIGTADFFGAPPSVEQAARGTIMGLLACVVLVLSGLMIAYRWAHVASLAIVCGGSVFWIVVEGSIDVPPALVVYLLAAIPSLVSRYKKV